MTLPVHLCFPRRLYGADRSTRRIGRSQLVEGEPLAEHGSGSDRESGSVSQLPGVEPERLLIEVTE